MASIFSDGPELQEAIDKLILNKKYDKILDFWVKGVKINWDILYNEIKPQRISLPTYPFAVRSFWMPVPNKITPVPEERMPITTTTSIPNVKINNVKTEVEKTDLTTLDSNVDIRTHEVSKPTGIVLDSVHMDMLVSKYEIEPAKQVTLKSIEKEVILIKETESLATARSIEKLQEELSATLAEALSMEPSEIDVDDKFVDLGLDSVTGVEWVQKLNSHFGTSFKATRVYDYTCITDFAQFMNLELEKLSEKGIQVRTKLSGSISRVNDNITSSKPDVSIEKVTEQSGETDTERNIDGNLKAVLTESLAVALNMEADEIDLDDKFVDLGLDSVTGVEWIQKLNKQFGTTIKATRVYDYTSITDFAEFMNSELTKVGYLINQQVAREATANAQTINTKLPEIAQETKQSLPDLTEKNDTLSGQYSVQSLKESLIKTLAHALNMDASEIDMEDSFVDMGLDSITGVEWIQTINKSFDTNIKATKVYDYTCIEDFSKFLYKQLSDGNGKPGTNGISKTDKVGSVLNQSLKEDVYVTGVSLDSQLLLNKMVEEKIIIELSKILCIETTDIYVNEVLTDMGLDLIKCSEFMESIKNTFGVTIQVSQLSDYNTINKLVEYIAQELSNEDNTAKAFVKDTSFLTLDEIIQHLQAGSLDIEKADELINNLIL
jgi:acyl carrier protein